jgi:hypothetical protein
MNLSAVGRFAPDVLGAVGLAHAAATDERDDPMLSALSRPMTRSAGEVMTIPRERRSEGGERSANLETGA